MPLPGLLRRTIGRVPTRRLAALSLLSRAAQWGAHRLPLPRSPQCRDPATIGEAAKADRMPPVRPGVHPPLPRCHTDNTPPHPLSPGGGSPSVALERESHPLSRLLVLHRSPAASGSGLSLSTHPPPQSVVCPAASYSKPAEPDSGIRAHGTLRGVPSIGRLRRRGERTRRPDPERHAAATVSEDLPCGFSRANLRLAISLLTVSRVVLGDAVSGCLDGVCAWKFLGRNRGVGWVT